MIVVSDTSVIINLAWLNQLDLLQTLYHEVTIPPAVWEEIVINGAGKPGSDEVQAATWIRVKKAKNSNLVHSLQQTLDRGEAEAIALAIELDAKLLLMDERLGRETAQSFDLPVIGLIGVLIEAKEQNLIPLLQPYLYRLRHVIGFHISTTLYEHVLQLVEEFPPPSD